MLAPLGHGLAALHTDALTCLACLLLSTRDSTHNQACATGECACQVCHSATVERVQSMFMKLAELLDAALMETQGQVHCCLSLSLSIFPLSNSLLNLNN